MAPTLTSHASTGILYALSSLARIERRDTDGNTSTTSGTVLGLIVVVGILSAIILGYIAYRGIKWYRGRHSSTTSSKSVNSSRFKHGSPPADITISSSNYDTFQSKHSQPYGSHDTDTEAFSPVPHTAGSVNMGAKTPNLDWRPPVLTPWSNKTNDSNSDVEAQTNQANNQIPYPSQAYSAHGRKRGTGVLSFMRSAANGFANNNGRGKADKGAYGDDGTYLMVGGSSPPVGSPPPQYLNKTGNGTKRSLEGEYSVSQTEENGVFIRGHGGATSPPLPPLPPITPAPSMGKTGRKSSDRRRALSREQSLSGGKSIPAPINLPRTSTSSRLSRVPTNKSRFTASSSVNGHGAIPSPRVSSLFRAPSRLSHAYSPASPGLPNPPVVPPIPALPAHLFRMPSLGKTSRSGTDSMGSMDNNPKHESSLSSSMSNSGDTSVVIGPNGPEDPTRGPDGRPLPRTMVVTCTFTPGLSDELPLTIGETVSMLEEYIDEWCFVQRVNIMVKEGAQKAGVVVSVHGTIDVQNTVTVPVPGDGNLGAVPRFCLSEWPLAIEEDDDEEEEEVTLGQETPTGLPMFTPPAVLPSPPNSSSTPTFTPGRGDVVHQPLLAPTSYLQPQGKKDGQPIRSRPLPTPKVPVVPEEHHESKFSSWGSTATQMPLPMQTFSGLGTSNTAQFPYSTQEQSRESNFGNSIHPLNSTSTSTHNIHPLSENRTPSVSSAATSLTAPIPPPVSPASGPMSPQEEEEEDNIKRVSKPPLAPRLSRFPPSPEDDLQQSMHAHLHGHNRNGSRSGGEGGIPRASERTVTMPPLPRRPSATDPSTADTPTATTPMYQQSHHINTVIPGMKDANAHWGFMNPGMTPSTSTDMHSLGTAGTSAGSKTPSTAATASSSNGTPANKSGFTKNYTSSSAAAAAQVARSESFSGPMGSSSSLTGRGQERKAGGMVSVSFKGLRTGSSTAPVGSIQR